MNPEITRTFDVYTDEQQKKLFELRELILKVASETEDVGKLEETLKWAQPSYVTTETKSGSTIRLGAPKGKRDEVALYFICHTNLVATFEQIYGDLFRFEGNRAILFGVDEEIHEEALSHCIALALTYHLAKRTRA